MTMTSKIHPDDVRVVPEWELCDRLRRSLRLIHLDNGDVAELLGVRPPTVSTWLNGHRRPNTATLMILADMCGVDRDWLIHGTERDESHSVTNRYRTALRLAWSVNAALTPDRADEPTRRTLRLVAS